ncbi:membrane-associated phospholipid phosphatase [Mucilaginibacter frigoritolerans]|jgi:membrane-associated phospholipid phosphatase|uniref:Membrane-associated phospholipid phosphatase n=1 Tax=Mucilaginibacter frigoritolerans TaxID=652788 RepID=A0A562UAA5_9SPHI|nr:phosphatase PAP2 family protein [Mucilaginibacter frigoritolerans]TWJ02579.1 membrane-associated phospholipid phosphatase [Mucilaginibacter frigoritolerans]
MNIGIKDVLKQVRLFFILYLVLLLCCLAIKLLFSKETIYFNVNSHYSDWADWLAPYFTDLGNGWTTIILALILVLFNYRKAFLLASAYAVTSLLAQIVKHIVSAPRPALFFSNRLSEIHFVKGMYLDKFDSFPSGHTVTAFSTAVVLTYLLKNKSWSILLFITAILVGCSRMYLSEHFFEDVTAGSALGVFITIFWLCWIDNKAFLHSAKWNRGLLNRKE